MQEIIKFLEHHTILSIVWILLLLIIIYTTICNWFFKSYEISRNKAIFLINKKNAIIIDIRDHTDFSSGHIINSINVSIEKIKKNEIFELTKFKKNPLIVVHDNNMLSHSTVQYLKKLGFNTTYSLSEGINGWKAANLPLLLQNKPLNEGAHKP